jgi:hypothetical protein
MVVRDDRLGVKRRRHRYRQTLGKLHHLGSAARRDDPAAGHDDRLLRLRQELSSSIEIRGRWVGPERGEALEALLGEDLKVELLVEHLAGVTAQLEVHWPRGTRGRDPERLTQEVG